MNNINHISPLDGRYANKLTDVAKVFSEKALMKYRCIVELKYVLALNDTKLFEPLTDAEIKSINAVINGFTDKDYLRIKEIENTTRHDVKACEIFLRERTEISNVNLIHFGLTSEDVNNLAYTLMLNEYLTTIQKPQLIILIEKLSQLTEKWKTIPFPCRTHGQKASPSTAGKEIAVYINRILDVFTRLNTVKFKGKLNGAVGNFSAMLSAFPDFDWLNFSQDFLNNLGLEMNLATTQIEDHDTWAYYFNLSKQLNNIVIDLNTDCWLYISQNLFSEKVVANEVGSSTMPHKVNPINFENSEGNLMLANSLLNFIADKLCRSRMQRDLSDSTVQRNIGVGLSHSYLGISETLRGLNKLQINEAYCLSELNDSPELLAEPIQTILKAVNIDDPYTLLKQATRGEIPTREKLMDLVKSLDIDQAVKDRIYSLKVSDYIGDAERICDLVLDKVKNTIDLT